MINGLDYIALTKMDVLDNMPVIKVCTGYEIDGKIVEQFPADLASLEKIKPVYKEFKGWMTDLSKTKKIEDLPKEAKEYIDFISNYLGVPYCVVSVGTDRSQTIVLNEIFK